MKKIWTKILAVGHGNQISNLFLSGSEEIYTKRMMKHMCLNVNILDEGYMGILCTMFAALL